MLGSRYIHFIPRMLVLRGISLHENLDPGKGHISQVKDPLLPPPFRKTEMGEELQY